MGRTGLAVVIAALSGVLLAGGGLAVWRLSVQQRQLEELRRERTQLREELAALEARLDAVEQQGDRAGLFDGLLDGDGDGDGGRVLDELLDAAEAGELFGGGDPGELFDGLLDGRGDGGGLEGLLGEGSSGLGADAATLACMQPPADVALPDIPSDGVDAQIAAIAEAVEALRGLEFDDEAPVALRPDDEFAAELRRAVEEDYPVEQAEIDAIKLGVLGAVDRAVDLRAMQVELLSQQAAGFYRPETGQVVVRGDGDGRLSAQERIIVAHELEHALADQRIGLPPVGAEVDDPDRAYGHLSAVEGGAVLVQHQFTMATLDFGEQLQLGMDPQLRQQLARLRQYPHVLQRSLLFPYEDGFAFACGRYRDGGRDALDDLVDDPPQSSAEVLFPERFGEQRPTGPDLGALSPPWQERETTTFGAAELLWLLEAPGDDPEAALADPRARAAGWDGGTVSTWTDDGDAAVGLALAQRDGEPDLCETMADWHAAAFPAASTAAAEHGETRAARGGGQAGVVACDDGVVRVGVAPTLAEARHLTR